MFGRILNRRLIRVICLHNHPPGQQSAPGPSGHLLQQVKHALTTAKVRQKQADVGQHHSDECHERQIEAFGDHLGADQHIRLLVDKALQELIGATGAGRVFVPAHDARLGELFMDGLLDFLRADANKPNPRATASRADGGHGLGVVALVAAKY